MGNKKNRHARQAPPAQAPQPQARREIPRWMIGLGGVLTAVISGAIGVAIQPWFAPELEVMGDTNPVVTVGGMRAGSDGQSRQLWEATVCVQNRGLFSGSLKDAKPRAAGLERVPKIEVIGLDRGDIRFRTARPVKASFILNEEPIGEPFKFSLEFFDEEDKYVGAVVLQGTNGPPVPKPSVSADGGVTVAAAIQVAVLPEGMCDSKDS